MTFVVPWPNGKKAAALEKKKALSMKIDLIGSSEKNRYCYYFFFPWSLLSFFRYSRGFHKSSFMHESRFCLRLYELTSLVLYLAFFFDFSKSRWDLRLPQLIDNQPRLMSINELTLTSYRPRPRNLQAQPGQPSKDYSFFDDLCCHFEVGLWAIPCPSIVVPLSLVSFVRAAFLSFTLTVAQQ